MCLKRVNVQGLVDEAKEESFNLPFFFAYPAQVESLMQRMVALNLKEWSNSYAPAMADITSESTCKFAVRKRAGFERVIEQHFRLGLTSSSIFTHKLIQSGLFSGSNYVPMFDLFVFLNRIDIEQTYLIFWPQSLSFMEFNQHLYLINVHMC